jgi:hypothetical protein
MMATLVGTGTGEFKKQQDFMYTSNAAGIGKGARTDPN